MLHDPQTLRRTLSEQVRDLYLDAVTDVILASCFRGTVAFRDTEEFRKEIDIEKRDTQTFHVYKITPGVLSIILNSDTTYNRVVIYL